MQDVQERDWSEESDELEEEPEVEDEETAAPVVEEEVTEPLPLNMWCQEVDLTLMEMTDFAECIETVGYFDWWEDFYRAGLTPQEAAAEGLRRNILMEDD